MDRETKHFYAFGPFRLDVEKRVLVRGGVPVPLAPKAADTLWLLVKNAGHLVEKGELMAQVWPDAFVEEGNLNKHVFFLRKALGEWDGDREYIETVPKRGYRFVVPVTEVTHAESAPHPHPFLRAELIGMKFSHYRVLEVVGGGGMGLVYKAEDLKLGRRVALKFLPEELAGDAVALQRFEREARTASSLNHPNICTIHEIEEYEGERFIVMELLEGYTLRDRLAEARSGANAMALDELLDIAIQVGDGLEAAHQKGIIHRDIKPANIFLTKHGQVKILDFGLAKLVTALTEVAAVDGDDGDRGAHMQSLALASDQTLTRTGMEMGTAGYMSPEQVRGEKLDPRTDVFSFGLVLYEMATGQRAFSGQTAAILHDAILNRAPAPMRKVNPGLPPKLEAIVSKALEKDRELRYPYASQIGTDLKRLKQATEGIRRHWLVLGAVLVIASVGAVLFWLSTQQQAARHELKLRQLTFNSTENSVRVGSAISPDGKYLVYSDYRGTHIRDIETREVRDLQLPEAFKNNPDWQIVQWFPDGTKILAGAAFEKHLSVWAFSVQGGEPRKLRDDAGPWSLSPDGSLIAFETPPGREIYDGC